MGLCDLLARLAAGAQCLKAAPSLKAEEKGRQMGCEQLSCVLHVVCSERLMQVLIQDQRVECAGSLLANNRKQRNARAEQPVTLFEIVPSATVSPKPCMPRSPFHRHNKGNKNRFDTVSKPLVAPFSGRSADLLCVVPCSHTVLSAEAISHSPLCLPSTATPSPHKHTSTKEWPAQRRSP